MFDPRGHGGQGNTRHPGLTEPLLGPGIKDVAGSQRARCPSLVESDHVTLHGSANINELLPPLCARSSHC